ncbi:MAG: hypothetical protein P8X89_13330 [Reinekea sp.]
MLAKNWGEPMGAPAIFEKQIEINLIVDCFSRVFIISRIIVTKALAVR